MPSLCVALDDPEQTAWAASVFSRCLSGMKICPVILLQGELGAGKTTFVRELVIRLPGGDKAEVSSPSFNLVNYYPTRPEVAHFDLYRLEHSGLDPDLEEEIIDPGFKLLLVEWGNRLLKSLLPKNRLYLTFNIRPLGRELTIEGEQADLLACLASLARESDISFQEEPRCR
ncbi:MAG: tRNA (adenosine(37)-N6)-threonylcarbamoyltransferase complex ATPase subunit type 1 TsaE [Desulfonatronovibrionaceae bacterium]